MQIDAQARPSRDGRSVDDRCRSTKQRSRRRSRVKRRDNGEHEHEHEIEASHRFARYSKRDWLHAKCVLSRTHRRRERLSARASAAECWRRAFERCSAWTARRALRPSLRPWRFRRCGGLLPFLESCRRISGRQPQGRVRPRTIGPEIGNGTGTPENRDHRENCDRAHDGPSFSPAPACERGHSNTCVSTLTQSTPLSWPARSLGSQSVTLETHSLGR